MIGRQIGGYVVERELAVGGFGGVYAGRGAGRAVAIKVLLAEHLGSGAVARFEREIAIVRQLRHPSIVELLAAGQLADGRPYCVMELLDGQDVATVLAHARVSPTRAVAILTAVGGALAVAHDAGIVHRDVSPSNVLLCEDGRIVLLDFGIAKLLTDDTGFTLSRQTVGSVGSMAPEQLVAGRIDARTDIYALGVLAYLLLTGVPPFTGAGAAQLHRFARRPLPSSLGAPRAFDPIVVRAMAIRPADRFASVGELGAALSAALGVGARGRVRGIALHLDGLHAPGQLGQATDDLVARAFRLLVRGATTAVWWRDAERDVEDVLALAHRLTARGLIVAIHVDELDTAAGEAAGGPLAELWRWVPGTPGAALVISAGARAALELA